MKFEGRTWGYYKGLKYPIFFSILGGYFAVNKLDFKIESNFIRDVILLTFLNLGDHLITYIGLNKFPESIYESNPDQEVSFEERGHIKTFVLSWFYLVFLIFIFYVMVFVYSKTPASINGLYPMGIIALISILGIFPFLNNTMRILIAFMKKRD